MILLGLKEAGESNSGSRIGANSDVDLFEVFGINAEVVKVLHVSFEVCDDVTGIGKSGTLVGGKVAEEVTLEVKTVFEGVLVAWLGAAFAFWRREGVRRGFDRWGQWG